jgi:hypothetical protein
VRRVARFVTRFDRSCARLTTVAALLIFQLRPRVCRSGGDAGGLLGDCKADKICRSAASQCCSASPSRPLAIHIS